MKNITVGEFKNQIELHKDEDAYAFINVCTPEEYAQKHIGGVVNIPLSNLKDHLSELKEAQHIYVHCQAGGRSRQAIAMLNEAGINAEMINVEGGLSAWTEAGFTTKSQQ